jgi:hypothetical protein
VATTTVVQSSFAAGILSPWLRGRIDLAQYAAGAEDLTNLQVLPTGAVARRPGSYHVAASKPGNRCRLVPFVPAVSAAYVLEFGPAYVRFIRNRGQLLDGSALPLELATPYTLDQLRELNFAPSADVLYVFHPSHQPRKISRTSADTFQIVVARFDNGPYDADNTGDVPAAAPSPTASSPETSGAPPVPDGDTGPPWGGDGNTYDNWLDGNSVAEGTEATGGEPGGAEAAASDGSSGGLG